MPTILSPRLRISKLVFTPANQSASGGQSIAGFEQVVAGVGGRWSAKVTFQVVGEEETLAYQAQVATLQGRAVECYVAPRDGIRPRNAAGQMFSAKRIVPWGNGAMWWNGGGWKAPTIVAATAFAAVQGATTMDITILIGSGLRPGHFFGLGARLYRVLTVTASTANSGAYTVTFWPRLRAAAAAGATVILDAPVCQMRLKSDDSGALEMSAREASTPTMEFIESFPAP